MRFDVRRSRRFVTARQDERLTDMRRCIEISGAGFRAFIDHTDSSDSMTGRSTDAHL